MMPAPARLNDADQVLIHAVAWLAGAYSSHPNYRMMCGLVRDALPQASVAVPMMADFAEHGRALIGAKDLDLTRARADAQAALQRFHMAKVAAAQERLLTPQHKETGR